MLVSFELREGDASEVLDVFLDEEGLSDLIAQLQFLKDKRTDHIHLFAESWGGYPLAEAPVIPGAKPMRHVQITMLSL
jgi:hypothetical protein